VPPVAVLCWIVHVPSEMLAQPGPTRWKAPELVPVKVSAAVEAGPLGLITTEILHTGPFIVPAAKEHEDGVIDEIVWTAAPQVPFSVVR
jgi:hypothetical protein